MQLILEILFEFFLSVVVELLFCPVAYHTGRFFVRLLSLGYLHVDPRLAARPDKPKWWIPLTYHRGRRRYLDTEVVILIGASVWLAPIVVLLVMLLL